MTLPINVLELKTERVVRAILRDAMLNITTINDYDHAITRIESVGWDRMYDRITDNYHAGYIAGGNLIRRHALTAARITEHEDPLVAQYTTKLIYDLERVASGQRNEIQAALRTWYEKGYTAKHLAQSMERFFDDDRVAASRFARTATNDIYNRAHLDRYEQSGVVDGVEYSAHIDSRTSDICRMLDGTVWALDDPSIRTPPSHFNCFIEGTRLEPAGDIIAAFRARYRGQIVELTLSNGHRLSITPNHALMTPKGFLAAKFVRKGDNIICRPTFEGVVDSVDPYHNDTHPTVEQVFGAFSISGGMCTETVPATPIDFHNDGGFIEGNVHVVMPKRLLLGAGNTTFVEHFNKNVLGSAGIRFVDLPGDGNLASVLISVADAADGRMSSIRETSPFFEGRLAHPDIHCLAPVSGGDPDFVESVNDNRPGNPKLAGNRCNRDLTKVHLAKNTKVDVFSPGKCYPNFSSMCSDNLRGHPEVLGNLLGRQPITRHGAQSIQVNNCSPMGAAPRSFDPVVHRADVDVVRLRQLLSTCSGLIETQKVIQINVVPFHGYVYDFQTISTLCSCNSIIASNCRSRLSPYFGKIPGKRDFVKEFGADYVKSAENTATVFRSKYWRPTPLSRGATEFRRAYFAKRDILALRDGLNLLEREQSRRMMPDILPIRLLKKRLRYRKIDPDTTTIIDAFGKSVMLDKFERRQIEKAIRALITAARARRDPLLAKGLDTLAAAETIKIARYEEMLDRLV